MRSGVERDLPLVVQDVDQAGQVGQPDPGGDRAAGARRLVDDRAADERHRRGRQERQHREDESGRQGAHVRAGAAGPFLPVCQAEHEQDRGRRDRPELDDAGEAEGQAGPCQPAGPGQVAAAERRVDPQQAEQVHPRFEHQRVRRGDVAGVDGEHSAGHQRDHGAAVADQVAGQRDARGAGQRGEHPGQGEPLHRGGDLGDQRHRGHQQQDARRLDEGEVLVRQLALDQPQRAADVHAVVVLGDARQVAGPGEREQPDPDGEDRRDQHHDARCGQPVVAQPRRAERGPGEPRAHAAGLLASLAGRGTVVARLPRHPTRRGSRFTGGD